MIAWTALVVLVLQDGDKAPERKEVRPPKVERPQEGERPRPPRPDGPPREGPPRDLPPGARDRRPPGPEEMRAWVRENEPELWRRVQGLEAEGRREDAQRLLMESGPRMRELRELKDRDPKAYERMQELRGLEQRSSELGERARQLQGAEREKAQGELKELLGRLFDLREDGRVRELAELKRRVVELDKALSERKANKDRIVEKRRKELMGEPVTEDW